MNGVLRPYLWKFALVFFDDILVYSKDIASYLEHLRAVFQLLIVNSMVVNKKKCEFGVARVEYLGHIVSAYGVSADPQKTEAMQQCFVPKDVKGLRGFLGLTCYYRRFVQGYGVIAKSLTALTNRMGSSSPWKPRLLLISSRLPWSSCPFWLSPIFLRNLS